jgi:aminopeptidase 2
MGWWEGLWLNEGFASFCERLATDAQYPSYQMWPAWTANVHFSAMALDALLSTHPIEVPVATSDDINETFDHISYHKGSCVVRMAYLWLGEENFFKALNAYFEKHAYSNTKTTDLWDAFSAVSGQDAAKVFRNWTLSPGFPYISVSSAGAGGKLKLNSSRFIAPWAINPQAWPKDGDYDSVGPAAFEGLTKHHRDEATKAGIEAPAHETNSWNIPLSVATPKGYESMGVLLLDDDKAKADRAGVLEAMADKISAATSGAPWFALNAGRGSFFRTVYDEQALEKLSVAAATPADRSSEPTLGLMDRIGVVGDAAAASAVGLTPISSVVKLLWAMRYETEYYCWIAMLDALSTLRDSADSIGGKLADDTKAFARKLLAPIVEHLGWSPKAGEAPNNALLRAAVLRSAALAGDESVVAECNKRFDAYAVDGGVTSPINADLKQLVYSTVGTYGGTARWEKLLALLKASDSSEEQRRLMTALGKSADATLLKRCLAMTLEGDVIRSQDVPFIIGAVTSNPGPLGRTLCWAWFRDSLPAILAKGWHGGNFVWSSIVGGATSGFDSKERADEITAFFADPAHPVGSAERTVKQNVEAIRNKAWAKHIVSKQSGAISAALAAVIA